MQAVTNSKTLSFSPLRLSDAGQYTCQVNVKPSNLSNGVNGIGSQNVLLACELSVTTSHPPVVFIVHFRSSSSFCSGDK